MGVLSPNKVLECGFKKSCLVVSNDKQSKKCFSHIVPLIRDIFNQPTKTKSLDGNFHHHLV